MHIYVRSYLLTAYGKTTVMSNAKSRVASAGHHCVFTIEEIRMIEQL